MFQFQHHKPAAFPGNTHAGFFNQSINQSKVALHCSANSPMTRLFNQKRLKYYVIYPTLLVKAPLGPTW